MRKFIVFAATLAIAVHSDAQLGIIAHAANSAVKHATQPKISRIDYDTTTIKVQGRSVLLQRYKREDLKPLYTSDQDQKRIAVAINELQPLLDNMKESLMASESVTFNDRKPGSLITLEEEKKYFDCTNYENEYNVYMSIINEAKEKNRQAQLARQKEAERIDSIAKAEDPHVITDFDLANAATNSWIANKIEYIHRAEQRKYDDSVRVAEKKEQEAQEKKEKLEHISYLTHKYGSATAKRLLAGDLWIGMTDKMVEDEYGYPEDSHRSVSESVYIEEWTYSAPLMALIFKNHKLIQITD